MNYTKMLSSAEECTNMKTLIVNITLVCCQHIQSSIYHHHPNYNVLLSHKSYT